MSITQFSVFACCGYVAMLVVLSLPIGIAAAIGAIIGRIAGLPKTGALIAAALGMAQYIGLVAALRYYETHLAGGPPEFKLLQFQGIVGYAVVSVIFGGIGGVASFLLCRGMR